MTLSKEEIIKRLNPSTSIMDEKRIVITPLLDMDDQIGRSEVDIRLGRQFILFKEHFQGSLGPLNLSESEYYLEKYQEEIVIPHGKEIVLHPGRFIIGSSLEYVALPKDIEVQVEGRSSWARLGLTIATATTVHPMYKGVVTLELSNNGTIPLELSPGLKIAQMIFHRVDPPLSNELIKELRCKYQFSIGLSFTRLFRDKDLKYFCKADMRA